ncbi:MAG: hypothetical protein N4A63_14155 [Vallitalea sp.]|jgi:uncharacterized membrane protein|nr:hypothetical protein [Vallitalea sp.]
MKSKLIDIIISLILNTFSLLIWVYEMIIASDIPVKISYSDCILLISLLVLFLIIYYFYSIRTKYKLMNILLLLPSLYLWYMTMKQGLIHHFHKYDTLISIAGFIVILILIIHLIFRIKKSKNQVI